MITPRNRLFPATFAAFLLFPCPSVLARSALVLTPVPPPCHHKHLDREYQCQSIQCYFISLDFIKFLASHTAGKQIL